MREVDRLKRKGEKDMRMKAQRQEEGIRGLDRRASGLNGIEKQD